MDEPNLRPTGVHCPLGGSSCRSDCAWQRTYVDPGGTRHMCCSVAFVGTSRNDQIIVPVTFKEVCDE